MTNDCTKVYSEEEVAELRQEIASLRLAEQKLRRIFESMTDAVSVSDLDSRIIEVNEEMTRRHGSRDKLIGMSAWNLVAPCSLKTAKEMHRLSRKGKGTGDVELMLRRADGSEYPAEVSNGPLRDASGKFIGSINIARDISQRKHVEAELRALSRQLAQIRDDERCAIARELHDQTGQSLTALKLSLDMITESQTKESAPILERAKSVLQELMSQVEDLSLNLWPRILDELGLLPALLWHCDQYTRHTNVQVDLEYEDISTNFNQAIKITAYRILQEALTNVARHARVDKVKVRVWTESNHRKKGLYLLIEDRGVGFDTASLAVGKSSGFRGMKERALSLGGKLIIDSTPGIGTSVLAELPCSAVIEKQGARETE